MVTRFGVETAIETKTGGFCLKCWLKARFSHHLRQLLIARHADQAKKQTNNQEKSRKPLALPKSYTYNSDVWRKVAVNCTKVE